MKVKDAVVLSIVFSVVISLLFSALILHAEDSFDIWVGSFGIAACTVGMLGSLSLLMTNHKLVWIVVYAGYGVLIPIGLIPILMLNKARENEEEGVNTGLNKEIGL